jgi:hypothetical protein
MTEDLEVYLARRRRRRIVLIITFAAILVLAPVVTWALVKAGILSSDVRDGVVVFEFLAGAGLGRAFFIRVTDRIYP